MENKLLHNFRFWKYRLHFTVERPVCFPVFAGTALRGVLGHVLLQQSESLYNQLFNPELPENFPDAGKYASAPPPFLIVPQPGNRRVFRTGENYYFDLILMGKIRVLLDKLLAAFANFKSIGIGSKQGRLNFTGIDTFLTNEQWQPILSSHSSLPFRFSDNESYNQNTSGFQLHSTTPLFLKNADYSSLRFTGFLKRLLQRINLLGALFCDFQLDENTCNFYLHEAQKVATIRNDTKPVTVKHYSNRSRCYKYYSAVYARLFYEGTLQPFLPLLLLGSEIHIGGGTTSGLGRFRIVF